MGLEDARNKMEALETAVRCLDAVKRHLNLSATEVKSQIHASISRNLEALRNREVWLLGQVDLVTGVKEATLQQQQARLNQSLGVLQSALAMARAEPTSCQDQLAEAVQSLQLEDLKPEETPYISFRTDQAAMREAIMSYGRVDAKGMPLQAAFVEQGHPSASLPRHFEEYEDAENHVFYKTVEEIRRSRSDSGSIYVNIPKLSTRAEDWLFRPTTITTTSELSPRCALPTLSKGDNWKPPASLEESSPLPRLASSASIRSWLSQIQRNPDLEDEDDFEIVDHSVPSFSDAGESGSSGFTISPPVEVESPMQRSKSTDLSQWLRTSSNVQTARGPLLGDPFRHIPRTMETWLSRGGAAPKGEASKGSDRCKHSSPADLKDGGSVPCPATGTASVMTSYMAQRPKDFAAWLSAASHSAPKPPAVPSPHCHPPPTRDVCASSRLCSSFSDCTSSPRCGGENPAKWLLPNTPASLDPTRPICMEPFLRSINKDKSTWLQPGAREKPVQEEADPLMDFFQTLSWDTAEWLTEHQPLVGKAGMETSLGSLRIQPLVDDGKVWLQKGGAGSATTPLPPCPTVEVLRKSHALIDPSDWLFAPRVGNKNTQEEGEKEYGIGMEPDQGRLKNKSGPPPEVELPPVSTNLREWLLA